MEKVFRLRTTSGYNCILVTREEEGFSLIVHSGWDDNFKQDLYWAHDENGTPQLGCSLFDGKKLIDVFVVALSPVARIELEKSMPCNVEAKEVEVYDNVIPLFERR